MDNLNFILKFKLAGETAIHVQSAARIQVDGRGGLTLYKGDGAAARFRLSDISSVSIQRLALARQTA